MERFFTTLVFILFVYLAHSQDKDSVRLQVIKSKLDTLVKLDSRYQSEVDISTSKLPLSSILQAVAKANSINITINGGDDLIVATNFSRTKVNDLLYFLCSEYSLELEIIGNIVSIYPHKPRQYPRLPVITYDNATNKLSYDLLNNKLFDVVKTISDSSGVNIVISNELYSKSISAYIKNVELEDAIMSLAKTNGLTLNKDSEKVWSLVQNNNAQPQNTYRFKRRELPKEQLSVDSLGLITANITNANIYDIILEICDKQRLNYHFISPINEQTSLFVTSVDFKTLLNLMFTGINCSYYYENGIYMFGSQSKDDDMISTEVFAMQYRTATKVADIIPQSLKKKVEIKDFPDLNSIIISGSSIDINRVNEFLTSIDKSVPLITMDIMIVEVSKGYTKEIGLRMGYGKEPITRTGTHAPGIDLQFGASSINKLINNFNGLGLVNLGTVSSDFYLNLKMLEDAGGLELQSTPKLSTLNGHKATLKSGETKYYKEINTNIIGTQNPVQSESFTWKSVEANMLITITPIVSLDNYITLEIDLEQTEFTAREEKEAPPGTVTRNFKSIVRVKNGEMVLLGGIERNSKEVNSSGLPFIARVPILKWIFGSTRKSKQSQKLNIFIKPTVL